MLPIPAVSRYLAQQGWDCVILDMLHGALNFDGAYECIHTFRTSGAKPFVRVSVGSLSEIQKVLDLGAAGVVVPMVNLQQEAQSATDVANRPPLGLRSKGGDLAYHYGLTHTDRANRETLLLVQFEHIDAIRSVEQILSVADGCMMGQADFVLSLGLGHHDFAHTGANRKAIQKTVDVCSKLGKAACHNAFFANEARERLQQGFTGITFRSDVDWLLEGTGHLLKQVRNISAAA